MRLHPLTMPGLVALAALGGCDSVSGLMTPTGGATASPGPGASPAATPSATVAPALVRDHGTLGMSFYNPVTANYSRDTVSDATWTGSTSLTNGQRMTSFMITKMVTIQGTMCQRTVSFTSTELAPPAAGRSYTLGGDLSLVNAVGYQEAGNQNVMWRSNGGGTVRITSLVGQVLSFAIEGAKMTAFTNTPFHSTGTFTLEGTGSLTITGL